MVMNDGNSEEGMGWDEADEISGAVYSVGEGVQDYSEGGGLCWRWLGWCLKKFQSEKWSILLRSMAVAGQANCLLVIGPPRVGKTMLVMRVMEMLRQSHPNPNIRGFYTREIREGNEMVRFEVVTVWTTDTGDWLPL